MLREVPASQALRWPKIMRPFRRVLGAPWQVVVDVTQGSNCLALPAIDRD